MSLQLPFLPLGALAGLIDELKRTDAERPRNAGVFSDALGRRRPQPQYASRVG